MVWAVSPRWMLVGALTMVAACHGRGTDALLSSVPETSDALGQARCGVTKSAAKPLVVEWPAAERGALEARASRGLVAVRYQGCEMEVLSHCEVPGEYEYVGLNAKRESVRIRNADELYARLPLGAAQLEAQLERAGELRVDLEVVGRKESTAYEVSRHDLQGRCDGATHFVSGLTVGAFAMVAGQELGGGGSVTVAGAGAGAGRSTTREVLREDGDPEACATASGTDTAPPTACSALLRVEVLPISEEPIARPQPTVTDPVSPEPATPTDPPAVAGIDPLAMPAVDPSLLGGLEVDPSALGDLDPAMPSLSPSGTSGSAVCAEIDVEVVKISRKRANPPFRRKAMDAVQLRLRNRNDEAVEVTGSERALFLDEARASIDVTFPMEWFHPLTLPARGSKEVEVLLPRHDGPRLHAVELEANPASSYWSKCTVADAELAVQPQP